MNRLQEFHRRLLGPLPLSRGEMATARLLEVFGRFYGSLMAARAEGYRRGLWPVYRPPVPVISVGNLAVGGTGKTPTVDLLLKFLHAAGRKTAVVSRGYGGRGVPGGVGIVSAGEGPLLQPESCGDEPYLLARRNPQTVVVVAPQRRRGVQLAVEQLGAQVVILDDGFQHLAVARDLDLVLLDGRHPLGNGHLLPAGLLRERPAALQRGNLFLLTRCGEKDPELPALPGPILHSRHTLGDSAFFPDGEEVPLSSLTNRRGFAFAGIADPEAFFADLRSAGLDLLRTVPLADHAVYNPEILGRLEAAARGADYLITTEKDGVKLLHRKFSLPCLQVPMRLSVREQGMLERILQDLIEGVTYEPFPRTA